jgi:integrase
MKRRSIDKVVKQAKRTERVIAQRTEAPALTKIVCAKREERKDTPAFRFWGPYREGENRFRLKVSESGVVRNLTYSSLQEAEAVKEELLKKYGHTEQRTITVGVAIEEFLEWMVRVRGSKPATTEFLIKMGGWLPPTWVMSEVTESDAKRQYQYQTDRVSAHTKRRLSAATHHLFLWVAKRLWNWAITQGYCKTNPWLKVEPVGRKPAGKQQLRIDEARKLEAVALQRAQRGDVAALGTLLMIYLGLRQGEVAARVARDIDDEGRVLWVPSGKTKNARRRLKIPEHLRPLVLNLVKTKRTDEPLFYPSHHLYVHRHFYGVQVKRLCRQAGVPEVVPHSLRGLHATLALEGGATSDAVAKALGHSSFAMTEAHYASPTSVSNARSSRVAETLDGQSTQREMLARFLNKLAPDEVSEVLALLQSRCGTQSPTDDNRLT